jgi:GNAT superfamily N-acetyltransferase
MSVLVYYRELADPASYSPSRQTARFRLERVTAPSAEFLAFLYATTGRDWHWVDRLSWTASQWLARQAEPGVEFWVAWEAGAPFGYFELAPHGPGRGVEIMYFGLLPHAVGSGQGGALLTAAVDRAWAMGSDRVYVNTCSLDHPAALANYQRRGFEVVRMVERASAPNAPKSPSG